MLELCCWERAGAAACWNVRGSDGGAVSLARQCGNPNAQGSPSAGADPFSGFGLFGCEVPLPYGRGSVNGCIDLAQLEVARLRFGAYLEPASSYLSVIELGLYESTSKVYADLAAKGIEPYSDEWKREIELVLDRQRQAMAPRLWPEIPTARYLCF